MVILLMLLFFGCLAIGFVAIAAGGGALNQIAALIFWVMAAIFLIGASITEAINRLRKAVEASK